ncbi:MAG TPA: hypothetical protein PK913_17080, partial [Phenylobacterium sp.]|nr:hypothetical protein [Phenylobacterium sp.]
EGGGGPGPRVLELKVSSRARILAIGGSQHIDGLDQVAVHGQCGGPGVRVGVDVNGDGVEDAYVLVAGPGVATLSAGHGAPEPQDIHGEAPIGLVAPMPVEPPLFG